MFRILAIGTLASALMLGGAPALWADPSAGTARPDSADSAAPAGRDDSVAQLPFTDREFLRLSRYDGEPRAMQDGAIALARAQCEYLDQAGSTAANRTYLAEEASGIVDHPYVFLKAAVDSYCPWNAP